MTVNITKMIIFGLIPIVSIYAGWRIQKFWVILILEVGIGILITSVTTSIIPEGKGWIGIISLLASIPVTVFLVRYYAIKYNEQITSHNTL